MSAVTTIAPHIQNVQAPDVLRALPGWLIWRFEENPNGGKPLKVPYYTSGAKRNGVQGRPEDRQQLTTFDAARTAAARLTRRDAPAGWERRHGDQGTSSNWRSPPRPAAKAAEEGRPYNRRPREVGRRREGGGGARSSVEAG